jgi:hypothetical protein
MLPSTPEEKQTIIDYMNWQAPDLAVEFLQKVYAENVLSHQHVVWDVHTNVDRWWVITNPTNLYSQEQFPNMDLAVTFHVGLCLRVPRSQRTKLSELPIEPLAACFRHLSETSEALTSAQEVTALDTGGRISEWIGIGIDHIYNNSTMAISMVTQIRTSHVFFFDHGTGSTGTGNSAPDFLTRRIAHSFRQHRVQLALGEFLGLHHDWLARRHHLIHRAATSRQLRRLSLRHRHQGSLKSLTRRKYLGLGGWRLAPALQAQPPQLAADSTATMP